MKQKVFCIGLNKTGTTTLENALKILGYRTKPYSDFDVIRLHKSRNKIITLNYMMHNYDTFQDLPWCSFWRNLYSLHPNARYILTTRSDEDKWLKSLINHTLRVTFANKEKFDALKTNKFTYDYRYPGYHEEYFKKFYLRHNQEIRNFFSGKDNFIEIIWSKLDNKWNILCKFLDKPIPKQDFPYSNVANYTFYNRVRKIAESNPKQFFGFDKYEL